MNIVMSYIDYNMAGLEERETFSCTQTQTENIYDMLRDREGILGCVLIATCNRTEIYLSLEEGARLNPFQLLCEAIGVSYDDYAYMNMTLEGREAVSHLCKVASGAESQIWGDGQITRQVDNAIKGAQKAKASDAILNTLFRIGVTAGKRIKTEVDFNINDNSTALRAVNVIKKNPEIRKVLVIGNGMIGRTAADLLVKAGFETTMTLRQYRHGVNIIPKGCSTVAYSDRYSEIEKSDAVISATLSTHYTVHYEGVKELGHIPPVFVDLAVPRDIDPQITELKNVSYYNIDDISRQTRDARQEAQMEEIDRIIAKYTREFCRWYHFREKLRKEAKMKIYVVGIGPGNSEYMTPQAKEAIMESDVVVGYTVYVDLVRSLTKGKEVKSTAMKQEVDRCRMALEAALEGKTVAFVCSGDAGVYGMAGIMAEVAEDHPEVEIITVPGITAACSGAAVLGAPLIHDFAVISLSDLLTPWETIEKRLKSAAEADFVVCLYNPKSRKRHDYIDKAAQIMSCAKSWDTPCGYVKNIGREGETATVCTMKDLLENDDIDMFTTVFVGNSTTRVINGRLVTQRGYRNV